MDAKKRIRRKVWTILLIGLVIEIVFDPLSSLVDLSENIQARIGLPSARTRWDAQKINHYKFDIQGFVPFYCTINGSIEVKDGKVMGTGSRSDVDVDVFFLPDGGGNTPFLCDYHNYIVPSLFDELQRGLRDPPSSITRISFDRSHGFISYLRFGSPGGWGLLSPKISDCCSWFTIENFQILDEWGSVRDGID